MTTSPLRRSGCCAVLALTGVLSTAAALSAGVAQAAPAAAPAPAPAVAAPAFAGDAYGSLVTLGAAVTSGRSAPVLLGCSTRAGISRGNSSAGTSVPLLATTGTVATTATTAAGPSTATTTARTASLSLLGGMVTASAVEASSATTRTAGGFTTSSDGTTFLDLRIAGQGMPASPPANTRVDLPGLGYVVLNEQTVTSTARAEALTVNAVHVVVTGKTLLGPPVGSNIVISHARSGLTAPVADTIGGLAYGSRLDVGGGLLGSGPSFEKVMPCLGTGGVVRSTTGAGLDLSPALQVGAITDTVNGTVTDATVAAETSSTVASASLATGAVTATAIVADASAAIDPHGRRTFADTGSTFGSLVVQGQTMDPSAVPANTVMALPGVGTLYLHRVLRTPGHVEVRMIELVLSDPSGSLPAGADLRVGVAAASLG